MFRIVALVFMMMFSFNVIAQNADICADVPAATKNLTSQEANVILKACRRDEGNPISKVAENITPENANRFSEAAKGVAQAVGIAAKELGIAANDFLDSPAGYVLAAVLLFNYGGYIISGILFGLPITIIVLTVLYKFYRNARTGDCEYTYVPVLWGMFSVRRIVKREAREFGEGDYFLIITAVGASFIGILILWANIL